MTADVPAPELAVVDVDALREAADNLMRVSRRFTDRMGDPRTADHGEVRLDVEDFEIHATDMVDAYRPLHDGLARLRALRAAESRPESVADVACRVLRRHGEGPTVAREISQAIADELARTRA